jgi:hypothetical protein
MEQMITPKPAYKSKTNWVALIVAASSFYPPIQDFIASNPETFATLISLIFMALRMVTKGKITIV